MIERRHIIVVRKKSFISEKFNKNVIKQVYVLCFLRFSTLKNTFTVSIISHCPNRFPKLLFYVFVLMEADVHFQLLNQFRLQIRSFQRIYLLHFMHLARCTENRVTRKQYLWRVIGIVVVGTRVIRQPAVVSSQQ